MARRRLPPGQRKQLRDARLMTLTGAVFVAVCLAFITQGDTGLLMILGIVFGLAILLVGAVLWWSKRAGPEVENDERVGTIVVGILLTASVLLGLASLGVLVLALVGWNEFSVATTTLLPRSVAVVAGAVGTVFFIGGPVALLLRKGRAFGQKDPDDHDPV